MDSLSTWVLYAHIGFGFTALTSGVFALSVRPGSHRHRLAGRVFAWAMACVVISAVGLSVLRPNPFLFSVALFSGYMAATGVRALQLKRLHTGQRASGLDWVLIVAGIAAGVWLVAQSVVGLLSGQAGLRVVAGVFGLVLIAQVSADIRRFLRPPSYPLHWLALHISRMMGAFIATVTAFSAVNLQMLPVVVRWLWPTVLGVLVLRLYQRRYAPGPKAAATHRLDLRTASEP